MGEFDDLIPVADEPKTSASEFEDLVPRNEFSDLVPAKTYSERDQRRISKGLKPFSEMSVWEIGGELLGLAKPEGINPVTYENVKLPRIEPDKERGLVASAGAATANTAAGLAEGALDPYVGMLLMGTLGSGWPAVASKLGLGGIMLRGAGQGVKQAVTGETLQEKLEGGLTAAAMLYGVNSLAKPAKPTAPAEPSKPSTEVPIRTDNPVPDLLPYETSQQLFTEPFGAEAAPIVGRLFGPRGKKNLTEVDKAVITHAAEADGVGKAVASAVGVELGGKVDSAFKVTKEGDVNVGTHSEAASTKVADFFEGMQRSPDDYILTPEQQAAWDRTLKPLLERRRELVEKYDLAETLDEDGTPLAYFPRIVTERPVETAPAMGGGRIGAKQGFQKSRAFESEAEGWAKGYKYETSIEARLVTGIERMYKAIADRRLIDNPKLGGRTRQDIVSQLSEEYAAELGAGELTQAKIERMADGIMAKGQVYQPGFFGKEFDEPVAEALNKAFPQGTSNVRQLIAKGNHLVKAVKLGFDLGAGLIQGQLAFYRYPDVWAKATANSLHALVSKEAFPEYVRANAGPVRELAQLGSPIGSLQDMMAGLNKGELLDKIPVIRPVKNAFARQFQTWLDVAKIEIWKAHRETVPKDQWAQLAQQIETDIGTARMESVGVGRNQASIERLLALAPTYYRGAVNMVSNLAKPGVTGSMARRSMAAYAAGGVALYYAAGKMAGMSEKELEERLDPRNVNFMQVRVKTKGGRVANFGFGGIYRSLVRLMGNMAKTSLENPGDLAKLDSKHNPIVKWLRGHLAPVPAVTWDALSGQDYLGRQTDIVTSAENLLPTWAAPHLSKTEKVPPTPGETALSFVGISGFSQMPAQYIRSKASEFIRQQTGKSRPFTPEESPYSRLEWALRLGDMDKARSEYDKLVNTLKPIAAKTPQRMIDDHFGWGITREAGARNAWYNYPRFTRSTVEEVRFRKTLSPDQMELYRIAQKEERAVREKYWKLRRGLKSAKATPTR